MTVVATTPAFLAGERRLALAGETIDVVNPATGATIGRIPRCRDEDVDCAVRAAKQAQRAWRRIAPTERAEMIIEFAGAVERDRERLVDLEVADNGSPRSGLDNDLDIGVRLLRYFAGLTLQVRGETIPGGFDRLDYTVREPFGVVARIIPFNHPLMFALGRLGAPLVAGNTVILKPSEHTSLSALALAEHVERIFPPAVVSVLPGYGPEAGDALVAHPDIRRIAFIGGVDTGRAIQARAAASGIATVTLELGGKSPLVIFADADREAAIDGALRGMRYTFQGQACGSTSRLLIQRDVHDDFVAEISERLSNLRVGSPLDPASDVGATINAGQLDKVLGYISLGREEGSTLEVGGGRLRGGEYGDGYYVQPALFSGVDPTSKLAQEEIFGPVMAAMPFDDLDDALRIANDVRYGLSAGIYTSDLNRAHAFARDVEAGYVWVNDNQRHFPGTPYGGCKDSGLGREEDIDELLSYTQVKNVNIRFS